MTTMAAAAAAPARVGAATPRRLRSAVVTHAAGPRQLPVGIRVNLGTGKVTITDEKEEAAKKQLEADAQVAAATSKRPGALIKKREIKLKDNGNLTIAAMTEEDCVDATKLIMALFFKIKPLSLDFLAKDRLMAEQSERVYGGLSNGVTTSEDRLLVVAKVAGRLVGVAEVSLPGAKRFGAENVLPVAPNDLPYISDVAVSPNQRGRGVGKALLRACEAAMVSKGYSRMYLHTKLDNEAAQVMFGKAGYKEPAEVTAGLTEEQRAERSNSGEGVGAMMLKLRLKEPGSMLMAKDLRAKDYLY
eukprot:CAMPEP_0197605154 /NCGR_PEP_ID=MMETSP1326-20131121/42576_1 /TAXON_ID=1155430 /ORGANISM="Genus nov. species nov., Strain RCC2288" /LENGTH=301 /DNA_ID=CAMNT_0043172909 /DNA_START=13 /DNA_END=918 /DNA_ORIENTATION=+